MTSAGRWWLFAGLLFGLAGCASHFGAGMASDPYGFFSGFWHGLICIFTAIINLLSWLLGLLGISFLDSVQIIGRPNTGFGYYSGFVFGLMAASSGGSAR